MRVLKALFLGLFVIGASHALAQDRDCYKHEIDPQTNRPYQNEQQWQADADALDAKYPSLPKNFFLLRTGYKVGIVESKVARKMRPDKRQHCYVGCRIANESSYEVAVYAAYFKEWHDLHDCNPKSDFDFKDIDATVLGAGLALKNPGHASRDYCSKVCKRKSYR